MHRTGNAGIKTVDGTQNLNGLLRIMQGMVVLQGRLVGTRLPVLVTRPGIPGARHHGLIVLDDFILDHDPVCQTASRCFHEANSARLFWPC